MYSIQAHDLDDVVHCKRFLYNVKDMLASAKQALHRSVLHPLVDRLPHVFRLINDHFRSVLTRLVSSTNSS